MAETGTRSIARVSELVMLEHDGVVEAPTWFGPHERPLLAWFTYPRSKRVRGAVVLCQPIAEEGNMAYRTFRALAQRLAAAGYLTMRFDYDGTGDSAGSFEDARRGALIGDQRDDSSRLQPSQRWHERARVRHV